MKIYEIENVDGMTFWSFYGPEEDDEKVNETLDLDAFLAKVKKGKIHLTEIDQDALLEELDGAKVVLKRLFELL